MMDSYNAWCADQDFPLGDEFRHFYSRFRITKSTVFINNCLLMWPFQFIEEKHDVKDGLLESIERHIRAIKEEYMAIEKKSSQYEVQRLLSNVNC